MEKIETPPFPKKPSKFSNSIFGIPLLMNAVKIINKAKTIRTCSVPVFLAPKRFMMPKTTANITAKVTIGTSGQKIARYAPIPIKAKAVFKTSASHVPKPPMVPTKGPMLRSRK